MRRSAIGLTRTTSLSSRRTPTLSMAVLRGVPPKVIRLAIGNAPNSRVRACFLDNVEPIRAFLAGADSVLELDAAG